MNFTEAIQAGFRNYVNFAGRAFRSEFWYWALFSFLVSVAAEIIDFSFFGTSAVTPFSSLVSLGLLLPSLGVAVRRLHDIDRSGWWVLLWLIPIIGWIVLIIWACQPGTSGPNRFGANPLGAAA